MCVKNTELNEVYIVLWNDRLIAQGYDRRITFGDLFSNGLLGVTRASDPTLSFAIFSFRAVLFLQYETGMELLATLPKKSPQAFFPVRSIGLLGRVGQA